jgi:hypothetical protein
MSESRPTIPHQYHTTSVKICPFTKLKEIPAKILQICAYTTPSIYGILYVYFAKEDGT